ncbi:hypothetical protein Pan44_05410 [Caulifigura coniformis]|uniref:Uncharacterized protein n=1 Tax=Caulifigura coniformis TaxID=2527983 RepID=A0A517S8T7_9PLAN|nr:hypothetical protein Pan44_05410 [Caulifigura coniformis]
MGCARGASDAERAAGEEPRNTRKKRKRGGGGAEEERASLDRGWLGTTDQTDCTDRRQLGEGAVEEMDVPE